MAHKNKKYDRELLITQVAMMRIKGKSTHTLLEYLMITIGMSRKIAYEILADTQKYIMEMTDSDINKALSNAIQRLEELYENGTNKEKLEVQKELNKLLGLYAAQKVEVSGALDTTIKVIRLSGPDLDGKE